MSSRPHPRRQLAAVVVACAAGAALVLVAAGQEWSVEVVPRPAPLPDERTTNTGGDLVPWLTALGWVSLAGAGALLAVRGPIRRVLGALLGAAGAAMAVGAGWAAATDVTVAGWPALCVLGGIAVAGAGTLAAWRGAGWPAMGARYERAGARGTTGPGRVAAAPDDRPTAPEEMWQALDRGEDPTE